VNDGLSAEAAAAIAAKDAQINELQQRLNAVLPAEEPCDSFAGDTACAEKDPETGGRFTRASAGRWGKRRPPCSRGP